jgi:phospholipid/cholesterol/gamma-HCH transport system permease protein
MTASSATPAVAAQTSPGPALANPAIYPVTRAYFPAWAVPGGHVLLLWHSLQRLRMLWNPMVRLVFLRQVYFVGVRGFRVIAILALATGALLVTQATSVLGATNAFLYDLLGWLLVIEAAPLFVAVVVIGRSATVIATDLALMKVRGELRALEQMRIDPRDYIALPRIVALTVSLVASTLYYQIISVVGGFAVCSLLLNVSFLEQMHLLLESIRWSDMLLSGVKAVLFGLVIGTIACFAGLYAGRSIGDVPRAQIVAYMRCLTWLVAIDVVFAFVSFRAFGQIGLS